VYLGQTVAMYNIVLEKYPVPSGIWQIFTKAASVESIVSQLLSMDTYTLLYRVCIWKCIQMNHCNTLYTNVNIIQYKVPASHWLICTFFTYFYCLQYQSLPAWVLCRVLIFHMKLRRFAVSICYEQCDNMLYSIGPVSLQLVVTWIVYI